MEKQISIIIPTYNMEQYIAKCLDSLLIPDLDQVEVWVVNDGSKDRSSEIAHSYEARYPHSIHVLDKPNGNYGSCINAALPHCTGRYVKVLDADDTFDTRAFAEFVAELPNRNEDVVITDYVIVNPPKEEHTPKIFNNIVDRVRYNLNQFTDTIDYGYIQMHCLTYKTQVFSRFRYHQTEGISYTDSQWAVIPQLFCKSFIYLPLPVYRYVLGREGQTMAPSVLNKSFIQRIKVIEEMTSTIAGLDADNESRNLVNKYLVFLHSCVYFAALDCFDKDKSEIVKRYDIQLKDVMPEVYNALAQIKYTPKLNFFIFKELRKSNYKIGFKMPLRRKIQLRIIVRKERLMRYFNRHPGNK